MSTKHLLGKRVRLRTIQGSDALPIVILLKSNRKAPSNLRFFACGVPSLEEEVAWIKKTRSRMKAGQEFVFAVENIETGLLIGTAGAHEIDINSKNCRIGILIMNHDFISKGYAQETLEVIHCWMFGMLKFNKVFMNFRPDNEKMRHIAKKLGYREVGILKKEYFWKGEWLDFVRYELTAECYLKGE